MKGSKIKIIDSPLDSGRMKKISEPITLNRSADPSTGSGWHGELVEPSRRNPPPEGEGEGTGEAFWEPSIFFRLHHLWHSSLAKGKRSQAVNQHPPMEVVGEVFGVMFHKWLYVFCHSGPDPESSFLSLDSRFHGNDGIIIGDLKRTRNTVTYFYAIIGLTFQKGSIK